MFSTVRIVTGRYPPAYIAALLIFLNVEANEIRHQMLSDYLAMAIRLRSSEPIYWYPIFGKLNA